MRRVIFLGLALGLTGCGVVNGLWKLVSANILGVMPKDGFSDPTSDDQGAVIIAVAGETAQGLTSMLPLDKLKFETEGEEVEIEKRTTQPGFEAGSVALLVDGSASMESSDPDRLRVKAVESLVAEISECSEDWSQSLFEFTTAVGWGRELHHSRELAAFGSDVHTIFSAAEQLDAGGGTPLWDAAGEIITELGDSAQDHEEDLQNEGVLPNELEEGETSAYVRTIIIVSDGADTASQKVVHQVVSMANQAKIRVHSIGIGEASDANLVTLDPSAVQDLREVSAKTGGYYGYVDSIDDLPKHAKVIAQSLCEGYDEIQVRFPESSTEKQRVFATMAIGETGIKVPFTFSTP